MQDADEFQEEVDEESGEDEAFGDEIVIPPPLSSTSVLRAAGVTRKRLAHSE